MEKITFCIPSKSNLRYLKTCIPSIRKNASRADHDIFIFVDEDTDGTIEWLSENAQAYNVTYFINPYLGEKLFGIGKAYDYCIERAQTDICMIFHADMMLGSNADYNAYKHLERGKVVCATRIEPPLHPNAGEKILLDFGIWPEDFQEEAFNTTVEKFKVQNENKITTGIFAPWMIYREDILQIGGHDPIMHSCREDSDLFNRFKLNGYELIQSWDSLVYHLTGRGAGSFDGDTERHAKWKQAMENSTKEFMRKWGSNVKHTSMMDPIVSPKYGIAIRVFNATEALLRVLEPWCDTIYVDLLQEKIDSYIQQEQPNTAYDLRERIVDKAGADVTVRIDGKTFGAQDFQYIQMLPDILKENQATGKFKLGNIELTVERLIEYQDQLINLTHG